MKTPEQIAFSVKIQEIKAKGPLSGFTLFQAFAVWLRKYIDPWVLVHKSSQEIKTYKNTYQGIAEQAGLLDTTLQAAAFDEEKLIEAYLEFISALIIDPFLYTRIQNPIFFFGHERAVKAGIYDKTLTRISHSDITFRLYFENDKKTGNYIVLNDLKPALDFFYSEITKIKLENNPVDTLIEKWIEEHYEDTIETKSNTPSNLPPTVATLPNTNANNDLQPTIARLPPRQHQGRIHYSVEYTDQQDFQSFIMPVFCFAALGTISFLVCLGLILNNDDIDNHMQSLPGAVTFPLWFGLVVGVVVGLTRMYSHAQIRDNVEPTAASNIFILGPMGGAAVGALISMFLIAPLDDSAVLGFGTGYGALAGFGLGLLCETCAYLVNRSFREAATARPRLVNRSTERISGSSGISSQPLLDIH